MLFGPFAVDLATVWLYAALRSSAPEGGPVMAHRLFGPSANLPLYVLPFFLFDALTNGEEIGGRGYLLPRLQARHGAFLSSLIIGVIWAVWHVPKFLVPGNAIPAGVYLPDTIAKAILFTWVITIRAAACCWPRSFTPPSTLRDSSYYRRSRPIQARLYGWR